MIDFRQRLAGRLLSLLLICSLTAVSFGSAANARFIQPDNWDPTLPGVGTNRYAYSDNDPVNKSDPNGHIVGIDDAFIGFALALGAALLAGAKQANAPGPNERVRDTSDGEELANMAGAAAGGSFLAKVAGAVAEGVFGKKERQKQAAATSQEVPATQSWSDRVKTDTWGKIPDEWGAPNSTKKGSGLRWSDPANKGNGVRIDEGLQTASNPTQQVDHVIVNSGGKVIGRDGLPIRGSIQDDPVNAHIPYRDWLRWSEWNRP
ncbi:MAG: hypothetical protein QMD99_11390 [Rhizobiaceae bacterium]|nr:hypothetical protein [Rhizobiaceae bacterium]